MDLVHESSSLSDRTKVNFIEEFLMDKLLSVIFMIGVLLLVLPSFLQSNSQLKQFLKNLSIWIIIVLINNDYPFALIKFLDKNFDEKLEFKTKEASISVKKPNWIS